MSVQSASAARSAVDTILQEIPPSANGDNGRLREFTARFLDQVPQDDLAEYEPAHWTAITRHMLKFVTTRSEPGPTVRVFNPQLDEDGFASSHTVVAVITDDMPFLVDSVSMAVTQSGLRLLTVIHPVYWNQRDSEGRLQSSDPNAEQGGQAESVMYLEVERIAAADARQQLHDTILTALGDVRAAVADWQGMRAKALEIADDLPQRQLPCSDAAVAEAQAFMRWVAEDNFTFLGFREYEVTKLPDDEVLQAVDGSGLGILRDSEGAQVPRSLRTMAAMDLPRSGSRSAIILTKTNSRARVHRPGYMDYIGVLRFNDAGEPVGEQRFLGLYTSAAYLSRPQDVPLIRRKLDAVAERSALREKSHSGKALRNILETLPRDELFQCSEDELYEISMGVLELKERARTRLFMRRDQYGRFVSCLVYLPRDRYNTQMRKRIEAELKQALDGERLDSTIMLGESALARVHLLVRPRPGEQPDFDLHALEARLVSIVRDWHDELRDRLVKLHGEDEGARLAHRFGKALPANYIEEVTPDVAAHDVELAAALRDADDIRLALTESLRKPGTLQFKVFRLGRDIALSEVLPLLENLGVRVLTEQLYELAVGDDTLYIQSLIVAPTGADSGSVDLAQVGQSFRDAFEAVWRGHAENDGFNKLVLGAQLDWRQVTVLRGYAKYLLQSGVSFSQAYMEQTLVRYPALAVLLVELFEAMFDPSRGAHDDATVAAAQARLKTPLALVPAQVLEKHPDLVNDLLAARALPRDGQIAAARKAQQVLLDHVASLDEDRIVRAFVAVISATLRTNFYQLRNGQVHDYISYKLDPRQVPDSPKPQPYREIFVYSARVEGVHLRFGAVARGGLRWSDRREDFRTEVLGLVKAQEVKNTVIVPVGSKGGFIVKQPPAEGGREALQAEGVACYKTFINGLLDVTDNLVDDKIVHPEGVVRHDGDDPYMVVAADKGTATFSDIANGVSAEHNFWLGDAFASGGSVGYDHKKMGITARGAWESVKRHFRSLGRDCQSEDFTCVGIGDMSGDVFGNGMLLSRHTRLVAAFNHLHVFLDPSPDAAASFEERERLFKLPRSTWADYNADLISAGGGVYDRNARSVPITPQVREVLGLDEGVTEMAPTDLISAILRAPVDLLWNGGIGTYIKGESESHADVGDRANNAVRINGSEVRARIIGEGGNLGMTQPARVEAAKKGVILNTDFIDNSAGVDTSDHEVNIKILLNDAMQRGELTLEDRNQMLVDMTDEVRRLVLHDNYRQNQAITLMEEMSVERIGSKAHFLYLLESEGLLDREMESLPSEEELVDRQLRGEGMVRPELALLLSYSKIQLYGQLLDSGVPEDPYLSHELARYFPEPLREPYAEHMQRHRLKREIIASAITNSTINRMGATFMMRMEEDTGMTAASIAKAFTAAREILDARSMWTQIDALDAKVEEGVQVEALLGIWTLLRNQTRWLLNHVGADLDIAGTVARFHEGVQKLSDMLPEVVIPADAEALSASIAGWQERGVPAGLAARLARLPALDGALDMVEIAHASGQPLQRIGEVFFRLDNALELGSLRRQIEKLPVETRWAVQARGSLRDELATQQRALTTQVLASAGADVADPVAQWIHRDDPVLEVTRSMLAQIRNQSVDYPIASVALRRLAQLVHAGS